MKTAPWEYLLTQLTGGEVVLESIPDARLVEILSGSGICALKQRSSTYVGDIDKQCKRCHSLVPWSIHPSRRKEWKLRNLRAEVC